MSNGQNTANILSALTIAAQLAASPAVTGLINAVKTATTEGRDLTDAELQAAVDGNQEASDALVADIAARNTVETTASAHGSRPV